MLLEKILSPVGINLAIGNVREVNVKSHTVTIETTTDTQSFGYDRLILAVGSILNRLQIPSLVNYSFSIDTFMKLPLSTSTSSALNISPN